MVGEGNEESWWKIQKGKEKKGKEGKAEQSLNDGMRSLVLIPSKNS